MMTLKQVSSLTGVSIRTLQFYDEVGLFKPTKITTDGLRLYDDNALEVLQKVTFFKELDFTLKEIEAIMENPQFDCLTAFKNQKELIQIKRDRLNALLELLNKLIKVDKCVDFKDFNMSEYFHILTEFKESHTDESVAQTESIEDFDKTTSEIKSYENEIANMAIKQFGSLEKYTKAMENNFQNFLSNSTATSQSEVLNLIKKGDDITRKLTENLSKDVASLDVQELVKELISFTNKINNGIDMGDNYWPIMSENYISNPVFIEVNDNKYGDGASKFIGLALKAYLEK
ncbi:MULTISPECIES: MerR family transcriptional regulator [unclassified Clostridioides]|uniref:MerR family transcriptional regulator n=1 Tax=unclassified Clostridioides TaxID=2635829 RepID=UPI001D10A7B7|nr:MerR family transcriptional regulator [Clostridioides sp. ES-S-0049-03]MCC0675808.1 MerR family transcriptional regulator [Clostridioides sp. ES-W-0018-02]MCC0711112.1 MerR family transcriptional regulator [Clostridioides sp. ES-W-0017-02]